MAFLVLSPIGIRADNFHQAVSGIVHIFRLHPTDGIVDTFHIVIGKHEQGVGGIAESGLLPCIHRFSIHRQQALGFAFMHPALIQAESGTMHPLSLRFPIHLTDGYPVAFVRYRSVSIFHQTTVIIVLQIPLVFSLSFQVGYLRQANLFFSTPTTVQHFHHR